jgi:hypothetical protein
VVQEILVVEEVVMRIKVIADNITSSYEDYCMLWRWCRDNLNIEVKTDYIDNWGELTSTFIFEKESDLDKFYIKWHTKYPMVLK